MTDMIGKATEVDETLTYDSGKLGWKFLQLGVVSLAAAVVLVLTRPNHADFFHWLMAALAFALGAASMLYGLARWRSPEPMLTLSPAGIRLRIDFVKTVLIPWHAIQGIDMIDISGRVAGQNVYLPDVTVVLVARSFYDRHIHVRSWILRGPGWDTNFIPKGDLMQVALQHEVLPATAAELRAAVEARWHAYCHMTPVPESANAGGGRQHR